MLNTALAKAIIDSGKKKKTIARKARLTPSELSKILHNVRPAKPEERERLAVLLKHPESELFPTETSEVVSS